MSRFISGTIQDMAMVTTDDECDLLNGAISNDLVTTKLHFTVTIFFNVK